jgi:predicted kinase
MKKLIIIRGVSGSGKSTLATMLGGITGVNWFEADMFMDSIGGFVKEELPAAHHWCMENASLAMENGEPLVIVSNTFTRHWEYEYYVALASKFNYSVQTLICQGRFKNIHGVPDDAVKKMEERFEY